MSSKAQVAAKQMAQGQAKQVRKVRQFGKFKTVQQVQTPSKPAYEHKAVQPVSLKRNDYKIIRGPVTSDKATRKLEDENTMTFWVDIRATKTEISSSFKRLYNVKPSNVNTVITSKALKKAYIRLPEETEAMTIANQIGYA